MENEGSKMHSPSHKQYILFCHKHTRMCFLTTSLIPSHQPPISQHLFIKCNAGGPEGTCRVKHQTLTAQWEMAAHSPGSSGNRAQYLWYWSASFRMLRASHQYTWGPQAGSDSCVSYSSFQQVTAPQYLWQLCHVGQEQAGIPEASHPQTWAELAARAQQAPNQQALTGQPRKHSACISLCPTASKTAHRGVIHDTLTNPCKVSKARPNIDRAEYKQ